MNYIGHYSSPLGGITLASDGEALTGLWFDGQEYFGAGRLEGPEKPGLPVFGQAARWLDRYFTGTAPDFTPPLALSGTPFQAAVWELLLAVPFGRTATYGEISRAAAARYGFSPRSAQAVGNAVGRNPISLIIPCHRVVGTNGSLTGYAGGLDKKAALLALEGVDMAGLFIPEKTGRRNA